MYLYELLKRANSCHVSPWTVDTVDEILIEGDAMYMKAFDDRNAVADTCIYPIEYIGL